MHYYLHDRLQLLSVNMIRKEVAYYAEILRRKADENAALLIQQEKERKLKEKELELEQELSHQKVCALLTKL